MALDYSDMFDDPDFDVPLGPEALAISSASACPASSSSAGPRSRLGTSSCASFEKLIANALRRGLGNF